MTMDGPTMSGWEKRILAEIEQGLRADSRLDRELRAMRFGLLDRVGSVLAKPRLPVVVALTVVPVALVLCVVLLGLPHF
jgi:hypothetical protein